jgi:dephospho-CoA kinase
VREIAGKEGVEPTRENLDEITKRYFAKYGNGYFLKLAVEKILQHKWNYVGISGIRSPEDVSILKEAFQSNFILIHVYVTNPRIRYERMKRRGSQRDEISYKDLLRQDRVSEELFHIQEAIKMAHFSIPNDGPVEELHRRVDELVSDNNSINL